MFLSGLWKKFPHKARHFRSNWTFYSQLQQQMERMCRSYLRPVTTAPDCPEKVDNKNYSRRSHTALLGDPKLWNIACKVNKSDRGIDTGFVPFSQLTIMFYIRANACKVLVTLVNQNIQIEILTLWKNWRKFIVSFKPKDFEILKS